MKMNEIIRQARERKGYSQEYVAQQLGVRQQTVQGWESGAHGMSTRNLRRLAQLLETTVDGLYGGGHDNVESARPLGTLYPLISWIAAGQWSEAVDMYAPGDAEQWFPAPCELSDSSFILRVIGDSMQAPFGESYPPGSLVFVDPELRTPASGEPVIARLVETGEVTFKVYVNDGSQKYLKPLNPTHLPLTREFEVIGTVVASTTIRKRT